jgi:acetolactate decarboxylase
VKTITCNLPDSLYEALKERMAADKASCDHVVSIALSQCLDKPIHTLFQVSTSAAIVEGLYQGAIGFLVFFATGILVWAHSST